MKKLMSSNDVFLQETGTARPSKKTVQARRLPSWIIKRKLLVVLFVLLCAITGAGLAMFDLGAFSSGPVHMPIRLASHFGELRPDHFHMGLDIRTNGQENVPVYAIQDGYVSRVRIEEGGTGRCLFIQQANGVITVYGHLNQFYAPLEKFIEEKQYRNDSWLQDVRFAAEQFPVRKGMLLAYSGNTGKSEAPHLHFEIRDARTGKSIDPQMFGIGRDEQAPPVLNAIYWYDRSVSVYRAGKHQIPLHSGSSPANPFRVSAPVIGLGITAAAMIDEHHHSDGLTRASVLLDWSRVFSFSIDSISEADAKTINATIDYPLWFASGKYVQYLFSVPKNCPAFCQGSGSLNIGDGNVHQIEIVYGINSEKLVHYRLFVQYKRASGARKTGQDPPMLKPGIPHVITGDDIHVNYPADGFYDAVPLTIEKISLSGGTEVSAVYNLGDGSIPFNDSFSVSMRASFPRGSFLRNRIVMVLVNKKTRDVVKGKWTGNWTTGKFKNSGTVYLAVDTIPPVITPRGWVNNQMFTNEESLQFTCLDGSGLKGVRATLDGHWILISKKDSLFTYSFDEHCARGKHKLVIQAADIAGNSTGRTFYFHKT